MGFFGSIEKVFEMIYEEGLKEWLDERKYLEAMEELYHEVEKGRMTEEEYEEKEEKILEQLREVRKYKKENGM